jgi:CspA family cold shock protein
LRGTVTWFNDKKGYGFIHGEDEKDYFLHFKELQMVGHKTVDEGDQVEFTPEKQAKGWAATKVSVL